MFTSMHCVNFGFLRNKKLKTIKVFELLDNKKVRLTVFSNCIQTRK